MHVSFQYPSYLLIPIAIASIAAAIWLYFGFKNRFDSPNWMVTLLAILRSLSLFVIGLLILVPFIKQIQFFLDKPVLAIGFDNSASMQLADTNEISKVKVAISQIEEQLGENVKIEKFVFGENIMPFKWELDDKKSDISEWLKFVSNQYRHSNLAGVVTISDGIYNTGGNPIYSGYQLAAPMYAIGLGDTVVPVDARISYINNNDIAYKGNQFPIRVGVEIEKLKGKRVELQLIEAGKVLETKAIYVNSDKFFQEFGFLADANEVGVKQYTVKVTEIEGELSYLNNAQKVFVEVIDADKNILIAYESPHPDIAALRKSIERNKNYQVTLWWVNDPDKSHAIKDFDQFHLVVLHNLPKSNPNQVAPVFSSNCSVLLISDNTVNFNQLNRMQDLVSIQLKSTEPNEVTPIYNSIFSGYSLNATQMALFEDFPPVKGLFADVRFSNPSEVLFYQKVGNVATGYNLVAISQNSSKKLGIITATGIWRWFLYDYSKNENFSGIDEMFSQTIQFLSIKDDKRRLRLSRNKFLYNESEDVIFGVSFYDKNYEPAQNAEIDCQIENQDGQTFEFKFLPKGKLFELNAGQMQAGEYAYKITATLGDEKHYLNGKFTVAEINIELMQPIANHNLLYQLANNNGGDLYNANNLNALVTEIEKSDYIKPIRHEKASISELIHNKLLFALLLLMLTTEWIIRKYKGAH